VVLQITDTLQKISKIPLSLFFIISNPPKKTKDIFHTKVKVEESYKPKIIQTSMITAILKTTIDIILSAVFDMEPIIHKLSVCGINNTTNYKGYIVYIELQQRKYSNPKNIFLALQAILAFS